MSLLAPPRRLLTWTATSLTTAFGGYKVYRRPARTPIVAWSLIGEITVPSGYTATAVEAQHISFVDAEAGWAYTGGQWASGWDYYVTVVNATTGVESQIGAPTLTGLTMTGGASPWLVSNADPYLSFPAATVSELSGGDSDNVVVESAPLGRDRALTRTRLELPYRTFGFGWTNMTKVGQDPERVYRAAQAAGATLCLHLPWDRAIGTLGPLGSYGYDLVGNITYQGTLIETGGEYAYVAADYNRPAGVVLNGSSQYATIASNALMNPGTAAFSVVVAAVWAGSGTTKYAASKGNIGTADGWAVRTTGTANQVSFFTDGATTTSACTATDATFFDGYPHVAIATSAGSAATKRLYRDGTSLATESTDTGTVTNAVATALGANNAGSADWMAAAPYHAFAYYARELTATEAQAAAYYLLGYPGYRMPAGAVCFVDLRDARTWNGVSATWVDLTGNGLSAVAAASPTTRGIPSQSLALIDRFG